MQNVLVTLPDAAKTAYAKITGFQEEPLLAFFYGSWGLEAEVPDLDLYLREYGLAVATDKKVAVLPKGWFLKASQGKEEEVQKESPIFWYGNIESCYLEKSLQVSTIVVKLRDREIRIDKCAHHHAERFLALIEARTGKSGVAAQKFELIFPFLAGSPVSFQLGNDGVISVMFVKTATSSHSPAEFTILEYNKNGQVLREYHFTPRR